MSDEDITRVNHRVPEHVRDAAQDQTEHGELSERVRKLYRRVAFGEDIEQHETARRELERVRDDKDSVRNTIRKKQAELEDLERKETRLEEKLTKHQSREDKYEGHLEALESLLYDGVRVDRGHKTVQTAANVADVEPGEVIDELQERNPQIPEYAFEDGLHDDKVWHGFGGGDEQ